MSYLINNQKVIEKISSIDDSLTVKGRSISTKSEKNIKFQTITDLFESLQKGIEISKCELASNQKLAISNTFDLLSIIKNFESKDRFKEKPDVKKVL